MGRISCQSYRAGLTLVEVLVTISIIAVLAGLLLPAISMAREASRRAICQNNIRQLGLASLLYLNSNEEYPRSVVVDPGHSWAPYLFPFIEEQPLYDLYNFDAKWDRPVNHRAIETIVEPFGCPSSPADRIEMIDDYQAATTDFSPVTEVSNTLISGRLVAPVGDRRGVISIDKTTAKHIKDGMSKTILFAEDAGRPQFWLSNGRGPDSNYPGGGNLPVSGGRVRGACWADRMNEIPLHGFTENGLRSPGPCAVNCTNNNEVYAFHPGGANIVFADGHTEFVSEEISIQVYSAMVTRAGYETILR